MEQAATEGWSIPHAAEQIVESVDGLAPYRATALARTDLIGLSNGASLDVATKTLGKQEQPLYKNWLATDDDLTRDSHVEADGQSVLVTEYFDVGGTFLLYPGWPFGAAEEIINCRCTVTYSSTRGAEAVVLDPDAPRDPLAWLDPTEHQTNMAEQLWFDDDGFARSLADDLDMSVAQYRQKLEEKLRTELEQMQVKIRVPEDVAAFKLPKDGFKNQFETDTSGGALNPDWRATQEEAMFGIDTNAEGPERPIYGYLNGSREDRGLTGNYGQVAFVLKPSVNARTTWTGQDSLSSGLVPSPMRRPSVLSLDPHGPLDPLLTPMTDWRTHYLEAQVHGGVTVDDVERIEVWLEQYHTGSGVEEGDRIRRNYAEQLRRELQQVYPDIPIEIREYGERNPLRGGADGGLGLGDDSLEVQVVGGQVPVPASDDAERRHGDVADGLGAAVEHDHLGVGEPVTPALDEHGEVVTALSEHLHTTDDSASSGGSQPSEGVPLPLPNEEATMSTTVTELAEGNGQVEMLTPIAWDAVLAVEGEATEDGRLLERGSIAWRDLPLTLMGMLVTGAWGHEGAEVAGRIDAITRVADELASSGELTSDFGIAKLAPLIADRTVRGVSVDLAVLDYEYRDRNTGKALSEDDLFDYWIEGRENEVVFAVLDGTIVGATVCPMPAIANAEISLAALAGLAPEGRALLASALEGRKQLLGDVPIIKVFTPFDRVREPLVSAGAVVELADPPRAAFRADRVPRQHAVHGRRPRRDGLATRVRAPRDLGHVPRGHPRRVHDGTALEHRPRVRTVPPAPVPDRRGRLGRRRRDDARHRPCVARSLAHGGHPPLRQARHDRGVRAGGRRRAWHLAVGRGPGRADGERPARTALQPAVGRLALIQRSARADRRVRGGGPGVPRGRQRRGQHRRCRRAHRDRRADRVGRRDRAERRGQGGDGRSWLRVRRPGHRR